MTDAIVCTRLTEDGGRMYGTLPKDLDCQSIIARDRPV